MAPALEGLSHNSSSDDEGKMDELEKSRRFVERAKDNKYAAKTVQLYKSGCSMVAKWLAKFHPECLVDGEIIIPFGLGRLLWCKLLLAKWETKGSNQIIFGD